MEGKALIRIGVGAAIGLLAGSAFWSLHAVDAHPKVELSADGGSDDVESLRSANANLAESLASSEATIAALRAQLAGGVGSARPRPSSSSGAFVAPRYGRYPELTPSDLEEMAKVGSVSVTFPCLHDLHWSVPTGLFERLGIAPADPAVLQAAVDHSNKRVADQVRPFCAKLLGKPEAADLLGTRVCLDAVVNAAKKSDLEGTHEAIVRMAQANASKTEMKPPAGAGAVAAAEQLISALTGEIKTFEAELATKFGPEDAKRIVYAPENCLDRVQVQVKGQPYEPRSRSSRR